MSYGYMDNGPEEQEAVSKGAALLDRILPGWHNEIDLDQLEMGSGEMCMMGQLFGTGVESKLAEEMYPKELAAARKSYGYRGDRQNADDPEDGYGISTIFASISDSLIGRLMRRAGIKTGPQTISDNVSEQYRALQHVCSGHDNRCLWAEEVASRVAKDKEGKRNVKKKH